MLGCSTWNNLATGGQLFLTNCCVLVDLVGSLFFVCKGEYCSPLPLGYLRVNHLAHGFRGIRLAKNKPSRSFYTITSLLLLPEDFHRGFALKMEI